MICLMCGGRCNARSVKSCVVIFDFAPYCQKSRTHKASVLMVFLLFRWFKGDGVVSLMWRIGVDVRNCIWSANVCNTLVSVKEVQACLFPLPISHLPLLEVVLPCVEDLAGAPTSNSTGSHGKGAYSTIFQLHCLLLLSSIMPHHPLLSTP